MISVVEARGEIERRLTATIRHEVGLALADRYRRARRKAELALLDHGDTGAAQALPDACPYTFDDLIADEWWPRNRHGLIDQA